MPSKRKIKERQESLFEKVFSSTLSLVVQFIFAVALVGGTTYLTVTLQKEEDELIESLNQVQNHLEEVKSWSQMSEPSAKGWFNDEQNLTQFFVILELLRVEVEKDKLEPSTVTALTNWCSNAITALSIEKGQTEGVVIIDELEKVHQQTISDAYATQINILEDTKALVQNWADFSTTVRVQKLDEIDNQLNRLSISMAAVGAQAEQLISVRTVEKDQFLQQILRLQQKAEQVQGKRSWAIFGVAIGVLWLITLLYMAKKYYFG